MSIFDELSARNAYVPQKPVEAVGHYVGWVVGEFIFRLSLGFFEGNIVKYVCRHEKKNGKADLLKARDYINKLIELKYPG